MNASLLQNSMLFRHMSEDETAAALAFLCAEEKTFRKGAYIFHAGTLTDRMGLVLEGSVTIENDDLWGNRTILNNAGKNQFFAETYALLEDEPMMVDVIANESCRLLSFRVGNLHALAGLAAGAPWAVKLIANILMISAQKNLHLSSRSFHTAPKTIRGRVMAYLNSVSLRRHSSKFDIPFDRQQLADYLNTERTALSKELGKMQRDGLIKVNRNHFEILTEEDAAW